MTTSPISFEQRGDREVAKLGQWEIGAVQRWPFGGRAFWTIGLTPYPPRQRPAASIPIAKRALLMAIADWFDGAGFDRQAHAVRAQADRLEAVA